MEQLKKTSSVFDKSRNLDASGALADTNENREIAPDNFYNEENVKADEIVNEDKKLYEKSSRLKKAKLRAIAANNKAIAKKKKNKFKNQQKPKSKER